MASYRLNQQQLPQLWLALRLRQALNILQMPTLELAAYLEEQIEQNPALEANKGGSTASFDHEEVASTPTLTEHLMAQARLCFGTAEELKVAEWIIGHIDERGFLTADLKQDSPLAEEVLTEIQSFDPPGIAAHDLRESLLIQLNLKGRTKSLAYQVVRDHFDLLLANRLPLIQKKLACTSQILSKAIRSELASLSFYPAARFQLRVAPTLIPDLLVEKRGSSWEVHIQDDSLPTFQISANCQDKEGRLFMRRCAGRGKWLLVALHKRRETLKQLAHFLIKKDLAFFEGEIPHPLPLTMKEAALSLNCHESTVARAVKDKYVQCPQGILPLKAFFGASFQNEEGTVMPTQKIKDQLKWLISNESKTAPLSDAKLALELKRLGLPCARRTVAKYRTELQIPTAKFRRAWNT